MVSRIGPEAPVLVALEKSIGRSFGSQIGWRPHFPWRVIGDWLAGREVVRLVERRPVGPFGLFTLTRIQRTR